jgi:transposase-like protein
MQMRMPLFTEDITLITPDLGFQKCQGTVHYFYAGLPVFSHAESDRDSFRMILSQFHVNGACTQAELVRALGLAPISLKRWVKQYREKGVPSFFRHERAIPQPRVMTPSVVAQAERLLEEGYSDGDAAKALGIKKDTLQKAVKQGRVRAEKKTAIP